MRSSSGYLARDRLEFVLSYLIYVPLCLSSGCPVALGDGRTIDIHTTIPNHQP